MNFDHITPRTPADYIAKALLCCPSVFAEMQRNLARRHRGWAHDSHNAAASRAAADMAARCDELATIAEDMALDGTPEALGRIMAEIPLWVPAFRVAAQIACIPHLVPDITRVYPEGIDPERNAA